MPLSHQFAALISEEFVTLSPNQLFSHDLFQMWEIRSIVRDSGFDRHSLKHIGNKKWFLEASSVSFQNQIKVIQLIKIRII